MLDVILYRRDRYGLLRLQERVFASLGDLARFFASTRTRRWEWAEVTRIGERSKGRIVRYEADVLTAMVVTPNLEPIPN